MNAAVIKVKFADPPKAGKKQATIKADDGTIYGVWPKQFGLLQPGRSYKIEFSEREFEGRTYRTIEKCEPIEAPPEASTGGASGEAEFVARCLAASIQACAVGHSQDALLAEARMWRTIYRGLFTQ